MQLLNKKYKRKAKEYKNKLHTYGIQKNRFARATFGVLGIISCCY